MDIRSATKSDLNAINQVIEKAVMTWLLPERVKRLALPSYRYTEQDLEHYDVVVAEQDGRIIGVAAWDRDPHNGPDNKTGLLIHGIYVHPEYQRQGIGSGLLGSAENAARVMKMDGLLLRSQTDTENFYQTQGLEKLVAQNSEREYASRYWKILDKF